MAGTLNHKGSYETGVARAELLAILKEYWGFDSFRPLQADIIDHVLKGNDTLAVLPTGGGKSLCYQLPVLVQPGLCLVISPLIALMKDQVEGLRKKNITAFAIYSGMDRRQVEQTLRTATESNCKFLYVSPERLETKLFREYLPALPVELIAVDEAHCISQWGYDFRPPYLRIAALRDELPTVPVIALTASATPAVQQDICESLRFNNRNIFRQSFERPNLSYASSAVDSKLSAITELLRNSHGSSIIYCRSRKRTQEITDLLQLHKISAAYYHAGLSAGERSRRQEDWLNNRTRVIVCTNAFGMGIDKPDVRVVIHADIPDCVENYYQEAGRAGRDNKAAEAVLLYEKRDLNDLTQLAASRFPSITEIRNVYQAVANYLQLPSGGGEGSYYDFDLTDFMKKFRFGAYQSLYSLKALEQDGWLAFNEQVFLPSTIVFTAGKEALYEFEKTHAELEPLIKTLLRSYEGIYDRAAHISERMIASLMRMTEADIKAQLARLGGYGIIEYAPQKDTPQLYFTRPRIRAEDLSIDLESYEKRKKIALQRAERMVAFAVESRQCRSRMIANYFGEADARNCGNCDNCRRQPAVSLGREEFEALNHRIINIIKYEALTPGELLTRLNGIEKEKCLKLLGILQSENSIWIDGNGTLRLK
jgi:ATP-dependent DNA helicase RecQ